MPVSSSERLNFPPGCCIIPAMKNQNTTLTSPALTVRQMRGFAIAGLVLGLMLLTLLTGCDDPLRKPGVEFKNKSTHDVTVYWSHYSTSSYADNFLLKPDGEQKIDADTSTFNNGHVYYDWSPRDKVNANEVEKDVVEFVDR